MDSLIARIPAPWVPLMRPFLQRAEEFQQKDAVVSYFLRTHVVHIGVKKRTKEDKEGNKFLNALLDKLSQEKIALGSKLQGVDGRTTLTKTALALFRRADEEEQAGQCNLSLVRLFFTAAVLFEATAQFTKDGNMDPIAAERCRYAKYTASKMKKSIDNGEVYIRSDPSENTLGNSGLASSSQSQGGERYNNSHSNSNGGTAFLPPTPPAEGGYAGGGGSPSTLHHSSTPSAAEEPPGLNDTQRPYKPAPYGGTAAAATSHNNGNNNHHHSSPSPGASSTKPSAAEPYPPYAPTNTSAAAAVSSSEPSEMINSNGNRVSMDDVFAAQKHAKQAVSALQFLDHRQAVLELRQALSILEKP